MQEVHWQFIPEPGSSPQRLFSLSLEDPLTWKPELTRGLRLVQDPTKINLSLTRDQGSEEDRGDYVCTLEFKNVALTRTVHVKVLQSKSKQIALCAFSSVLQSQPSYEILFACSFVIVVSQFIFLNSHFFSPS